MFEGDLLGGLCLELLVLVRVSFPSFNAKSSPGVRDENVLRNRGFTSDLVFGVVGVLACFLSETGVRLCLRAISVSTYDPNPGVWGMSLGEALCVRRAEGDWPLAWKIGAY